MSENTMRVIQTISREFDFAEDEFAERAIESMEKMAAERDMAVDRDTLRYIGEVEPPARFAESEAVKANEIGFYAFEAEAI